MSDNIRVSDHAVIRYLERYYKFDIDKIRQEILTPEHRLAIKAGAKRIKVNGIDFIICNNIVVTSIKPVRRKIKPK